MCQKVEGVGIDRYADAFELTADLAQPISAYSHGMRQKLMLIAALVHQPSLLVLDEPFTGLDADNRAAAQRCVARAAREKIVLLVSHEDDALTGAEVRLQ